jgi:succinate dehydrogenase / fumarate reductase flavoprotein subunit
MTEAYKRIDHSYDVVVVGAGGSGLRATMGAAEKGLKTACITKVFPPAATRSPRRAGIAASLGNMGPDHWTWHMYDTVKGSDWLGDQDAIEYMVREAPGRGYELEHAGVPFSRTAEGKIYQRPFRRAHAEYGRRPARAAHLRRRRPHRPRHAPRALPAEPALRRRLLHRIFRARPDHGRRRVPRRDRAVLEDGTIHRFRARRGARDGGYGRAYFTATSAHTCTGDGNAMVLAPACRSRTWSSSSSTRPASTERAC